MNYFTTGVVIATLFHCVSGENILSRRSLEDMIPDDILKLFGRSMGHRSIGMDHDKQFEIDKRGFEIRGEEPCEKCDPPTAPDGCSHGFNPVFTPRGNCSCIEKYECCPGICTPPTDDCSDGKTYADTVQNCCNCDEIVCRDCPEMDAKCENECDEPEIYSNILTKCPEFRCKRKTKPTQPPPICNSTCQTVVMQTDKCGFNQEVCKCMEPPMCAPAEPQEKACHHLVQVFFDGSFGCKEDKKTCQQCFYWQYVQNAAETKEITCPSCRIKQYEKDVCGVMQPKCMCRNISSCFPKKPDPRPCHTRQKEYIHDLTVCGDGEDEGKCVQCFRWVYKAQDFTNDVQTCDTRCTYTKPESLECGSRVLCVCRRFDPKICQPKPITSYECFEPRKVLAEEQFMCADVEANHTCIQCFAWEYDKKMCDVKESEKVCLRCQTRVVSTDHCGCLKVTCQNEARPKCRPPKPDLGPCYEEPKINILKMETNENGVCLNCFSWNRTKKEVADEDDCEYRHLPDECFGVIKKPALCDSIKMTCLRHHIPCEETYTNDKCPDTHTMVKMKSQCGDDRHGCVDCSKVFDYKPPAKIYPPDCYNDNDVTILDKCKFTIHSKKQCNNNELLTSECLKHGMKRRNILDNCGCPRLMCTGCPDVKQMDIQLLLDGSSSISSTDWSMLIEELQTNFIDAIMTNVNSRMAIAKFGDTYQEMTPLSNTTNARSLNDYKGWPYMGKTHLAEALEKSYESFAKATNGSIATKILVVITDGKANGPGDNVPGDNVPKAVEKWMNVAEQILALGFGTVSEEGLKEIASRAEDDFYKEPNLLALLNKINGYVIPKICGAENQL